MPSDLANRIADLVTKHAGRLAPPQREVAGREPWKSLRATGSDLWLDTGDMDEADELWSAEFSGLTTNNSSLNTEVQKGIYDDLIQEAWEELKGYLDERRAAIELAFVLNAVHGLRLAKRFNCEVSVEVHTDCAHDVEDTLIYARRLHEISPKHFTIKVPFTPAGLIAARLLGQEGIPVNLTVGLSARQAFLAASVSAPKYVNCFVMRIGAFLDANHLGNGAIAGIRAALACQQVVREVNRERGTTVKLITASMRAEELVPALAGVDVQTLNPAIARAFGKSGVPPSGLEPQLQATPALELAPGISEEEIGFPTLWWVPDAFKNVVRVLAKARSADLTPARVEEFLRRQGFRDLLPVWTERDLGYAREDGKIPRLERWRERLAAGDLALDAVMNLSVLTAFIVDQEAMDERILRVRR